jgi:hypothetical protein
VTENSASPRSRFIAIALAFGAVVLAGALPWVFSILGPNAQPWNLQIIGALGLFAAARLGCWPAVGLVGLAIASKDASVYLVHGYRPSPYSWPCFIGYAVLGWALLRKTSNPLVIGAGALSGSLYFFILSNFVCWLDMPDYYERSFNGLVDCYIAAIPFYRGTVVGDLLFTFTLFAAHAALCRAAAPAGDTATVQPDQTW